MWVSGLCGFQLGCGGLFSLIGLFFGPFLLGFYFLFFLLDAGVDLVAKWEVGGVDLDKWVLIHFLFFV